MSVAKHSDEEEHGACTGEFIPMIIEDKIAKLQFEWVHTWGLRTDFNQSDYGPSVAHFLKP